MIIKKEENKQIYNSNGASGFLIANSNKCEFVRLNLQAGSIIDIHSLPFPVTFYVVKGKPEVIFGENSEMVECGDLIELPAGTNRGWKNSSNADAEILVIKHL